MGRHRRPIPVTMTSISITMQTLELISKFKTRRENQDHFIRKIFAEGEDLKDYRLDMDKVIKIKDRQIATLENELKEKQKIRPSSF